MKIILLFIGLLSPILVLAESICDFTHIDSAPRVDSRQFYEAETSCDEVILNRSEIREAGWEKIKEYYLTEPSIKDFIEKQRAICDTKNGKQEITYYDMPSISSIDCSDPNKLWVINTSYVGVESKCCYEKPEPCY